jgi:histone deacetylase 1/2
MENANSYEYLEKIKIAVIENLKRTAPVPSVQMQDVPRQGLGMSDEEEAELDDLDADENPDVRMTQRQWEKSTVRQQDELYESDDDEMAQANGVYKNGKTRRSILDHPNPHADADMDSGIATPVKNGNGTVVASNETADETMVDDAGAEVEQPTKENTSPMANADGDVDMVDASEPAADATVKNEEADIQASLPPVENNKASATETSIKAVGSGTDAVVVSGEGDKPTTVNAAVEGDRMETDEPQTKSVKAGSPDARATPSKA